MSGYKYELHTHTREVSRCGAISAVDLVRFYKKMGFSGLCITDHFFNGNTVVPHNLSWEERVNLFCVGYETAREEGKKVGIDVFFGWEYSYHGTDFLTYGLDKEWLLGHPEVLDLRVSEYLDLVRSEGGFVVHAHPFRESGYIEMIRLIPRKVDGVEVVNASRYDFENERAKEYAQVYGLLEVAGSDNHRGYQERLGGVCLEKPVQSLQELIDAIRDKRAEVFVEYLPKAE